MPVKSIVFLGLGSNLNSPIDQINQAITELANLPRTTMLDHSSLHHSKPLGPQDQPDFINAVVKLETELAPMDLLKACQALEQQHGRIKTRHWGERTLDIDILLYGNQLIDLPELTVPHPEMMNRAFVLQPLAEIAPELILPPTLSS
ncbi:MAG: 2-amino-4-hydroxy-6-hydroxymethyldihydropteridine diphosphokinase [Gammaproteobacteria bacterium]|nr:2-amino-4-hydroxy-6-hydroxymethyldihydropteridine diphosphokinase [Gammaproteobacteria bacterium]